MRLRPFCAALLVPVVGSLALAGFTAGAPTPPNVVQATETTEALIGAVVAAVASISDQTPPGASAEEVAANSAAVSLLLPKGQSAYRLLDATGAPLDPKNRAKGSFEKHALLELLGGAPAVQSAQEGRLRTLVPLTSDMHPNCVSCHTNYAGLPSGTVVGAGSFQVKL